MLLHVVTVQPRLYRHIKSRKANAQLQIHRLPSAEYDQSFRELEEDAV